MSREMFFILGAFATAGFILSVIDLFHDIPSINDIKNPSLSPMEALTAKIALTGLIGSVAVGSTAMAFHPLSK